MLIGFTVKNFRSIRDENSISLEASNYYKENSDTLIFKEIPGMKGVRLLPVSAIYGANASGKSTLVDAMRVMRQAVLALQGFNLNPLASYEPFLLDESLSKKPMSFSVEFCLPRNVEEETTKKIVRYEYSFSVSKQGIVDEELWAYYTRQPSRLFLRHMSSNGKIAVEGSRSFPISSDAKSLIGPWLLVLSLFEQTAVAKAGDEARTVCNWFRNSLIVVKRGPGQPPLDTYSGEVLDGVDGTDYQRNFIRTIMQKADAGITSIEVCHEASNGLPDQIRELFTEEAVKKFDQTPQKRIAFSHQNVLGGNTEIPMESAGTLQLFQLAGYIGKAIESGGTLIVDELDASLHPDLITAIISVFLNPNINRLNAQLIFTAHNPCLMDNPLMRRDEFWIMEKSHDGASTLYPMSDFRIRKGESLRAGYLAGKYAGLPDVEPSFGVSSPKGGETSVS